MFPAMYCTLWREILDAENDIKAFLNSEMITGTYLYGQWPPPLPNIIPLHLLFFIISLNAD